MLSAEKSPETAESGRAVLSRLLPGILGVTGAVLYTGGFFLLAFLPLQIIASGRGCRKFLWSAGIFLLTCFVLRQGLFAFQKIEIIENGTPIVLIDFSVLLLFILGLYTVNFGAYRKRRLDRFLIHLTGAGLFFILMIALFGGMGKVLKEMETFFLRLFKEMIPSGDTGSFLHGSDLPALIRISVRLFWTYSLAFYGFVLAFTIQFGTRLSLNIFKGTIRTPVFRVSDFYLSPRFIWFFLAGFAFILFELSLSLLKIHGERFSFEYILMNFFIIFSFLYTIQGLSVLKFVLETKYSISKQTIKLCSLISVLVLFFIPVLIGLLFLFLTGLGIAEVWINFRRMEVLNS